MNGNGVHLRNPRIDVLMTYEATYEHGSGALVMTQFRHFDNPRPRVWHTRSLYNPAPRPFRNQGVWGWNRRKHASRFLAALHRRLDEPGMSARLRSREGLRWWMRLHGGPAPLLYVAPFDEVCVEMAIMAAEEYGSKLMLHVLDDCSIHFNRAPKDRMKRLIDLSGARLAISPAMAEEYSAFSGHRFDVLYMPIAAEEFPPAPRRARTEGAPPRLVMVGNFYGDTFPKVRDLLETMPDLRLTCFGPIRPGNREQEAYMKTKASRIDYQGMVDATSPAEMLRRISEFDIALMPQGSLLLPEVGNFFRLSLPSRMASYMAAGLPILVLGDAESGAARFVHQHGVGRHSGYGAESFQQAVGEMVRDPGAHLELRRRCRGFCEGKLHLESTIEPWLRMAFTAMASGVAVPPPPSLD